MKLLVDFIGRCDIFHNFLNYVAVVVLIICGCDLDMVIAADHAILDRFVRILYFECPSLFGQDEWVNPIDFLDKVDNSSLFPCSLRTIEYHMLNKGRLTGKSFVFARSLSVSEISGWYKLSNLFGLCLSTHSCSNMWRQSLLLYLVKILRIHHNYNQVLISS